MTSTNEIHSEIHNKICSENHNEIRSEICLILWNQADFIQLGGFDMKSGIFLMKSGRFQ